MNPSYGPARVSLFGGLYPDGETIELAKIDLLGESPNAAAKLYQWQPEPGLGRFREIDRLTGATIKGGDDGFTITGTSDQLLNEVKLSVEEAQVTWVVTPKGCQNCN